MMRILVLSMVILTALFALMLGAIRSRAYVPDAAYEQFDIEPEAEDCPLPCWRGIRPGGTRGDFALRRLEQMEDVIDVTDTPTATSLQGETRFISWRWRDSSTNSTSGLLIIEDSIVQEIYMTMRLQLGDVWLSLGQPLGGEASLEGYGESGTILHLAVYADRGLTVGSYLDCPIVPPRLWTRPTFVWLRDIDDLRFAFLRYDDYLRRRTTVVVLGRREYC